MTTSEQQPRGVLLVGSVPLENAESVFRTSSQILGARLRRIPDGETGVRTNWFAWQRTVMETNPQLEEIRPESSMYASEYLGRFRVRPGSTVQDIHFGPLGYADVAKESYAIFTRLKQNGTIPAHLRFQVSLPTPVAPIAGFLVPEDQVIVETAYERRMLAEVDELAATIPHHDLSIQWDTAVENLRFLKVSGLRYLPTRICSTSCSASATIFQQI